MVFGVGTKADAMTEVVVCRGSACEGDDRELVNTRNARMDVATLQVWRRNFMTACRSRGDYENGKAKGVLEVLLQSTYSRVFES